MQRRLVTRGAQDIYPNMAINLPSISDDVNAHAP